MTIRRFIKLAQFQTTIATFLTTLLGMFYAWYCFGHVNVLLSGLAISVVILFLLAVNVRDHYVDYEVALARGDSSHKGMVITEENIPLKNVRYTYYFLGLLSGLIGVYVVMETTFFALFAALICVLIGVLYAAGPIPISSTPFGEVVTGIAMGFGVFFSTFYINAFDFLDFDLSTIMTLLIASTPTTVGAINIVLANNISDVEQDAQDDRFTLPYYIGVKNALIVYQLLYYLAYLFIVIAIALDIYPKLALLAMLSFPMIQRNINYFKASQEKEAGLKRASQNATLIAASILIPFVIVSFITI